MKGFTQIGRISRQTQGRLVMVLLLALAAGPAAADPPAIPTTAEVVAPGAFGVGHVGQGVAGETPLILTDTVRERSIALEIWYPAALAASDNPHLEQQEVAVDLAAAPYPLIVYSHGFMSTSSEGTILNQHLASHGYIVVAPSFPFTNLFTPGGPDIADVVNQPDDVRFLVDRLLAWNLTPGDRFEGAVDSARIGFVGLSLGGLTTLLASYHPELRDPRVSVAVPIAAPGDFFGEAFYDFADVPLMLLASDRDAIVSYPHNALAAFARANLPKTLVTLVAGSHTGWSNFGLLLEGYLNPDTLGCDALVDQLPGEGGSFTDLLGGASAGLVPSTAPYPCSGVLAGWLQHESMRPSRQHDLTIAAVRPFLDLHLSADPARQASASVWLGEGLAAQNADLHVCTGDVVCLPEPSAGLLAGSALAVIAALRSRARRRSAWVDLS